MKQPITAAAFILLTAGILLMNHTHGLAENGSLKLELVLNPFSGSRQGSDVSAGPTRMLDGGLKDRLKALNCPAETPYTVELTAEQNRAYGEWNRMGMANGHLQKRVSRLIGSGQFVVGLLANCNSLMGMLAGLQHSGKSNRPLRVGLVWIDAHGDFNTPETTLSGMLGGMPVAVSTGLCLHRLRRRSGLEPALPPAYITMAGVRDTDPLEQELIDRHGIAQITVNDIRNLSTNINQEMERLSRLTDIIYIHIDMDVLEPDEVSGHGLTVPDGPSSKELAAALTVMFKFEKSAALGIASYPHQRDEDKKSLTAAYRLIEGAIRGVKERKRQ